MRNILFLTVLIFGLGSSSIAQDRVFHAGLIGGISFAQVLNDGLQHYSKLGFYGGAFISTEFSELWSGEIGMTYVMKGSKERQSDYPGSFNGYKMTLGYVEFPFIVKFRMQKIDIEFGLSAGILVNSKEDNYYQSDVYSATKFETFELAGIIGVNYDLDDKWGLNLRSSNSILPIRYPSDNVYHPPLYGQRNIVITFAVRYFIR